MNYNISDSTFQVVEAVPSYRVCALGAKPSTLHHVLEVHTQPEVLLFHLLRFSGTTHIIQPSKLNHKSTWGFAIAHERPPGSFSI